MIGTAAYKPFKRTLVSSGWLKKIILALYNQTLEKIDDFITIDLKRVWVVKTLEKQIFGCKKYTCTFYFPPSLQN